MATVSRDAPAGRSAAELALDTRWWHAVPETGRIACDLCPRACQLKPGDRGFCFVRENRDGQMALSTYGRSTGFCIDPIEKKPLNHFYPGTSVLSFGTAGCNLGCKFCQNWDISKSRAIEKLSEAALPEAIAEAAQQLGCRSVAFTYNDPVVWAEYAIDTARACRAQGIKTVAVTAGYITPEARGPFYEFMDAANVDLKAFTEDFYWHMTQSHLEPVLETLRWLRAETDVWFELTNLVIPQANDSPDEFRRMCAWVLDNLGDRVPLHFTAFHPDFRLTDRPNTPHETLLAAYEIARQAGLKYIYVGNVHDRAHSSTYCPGCGELLIDRDWHQLHAYRLRENHCARCNAEIAGRFDAAPGNWGAQRLPVDMSRFARGPAFPLPVVSSPAAAAPHGAFAAASAGHKIHLSPAPPGLPLTDEQQRQIHWAAWQVVLAKAYEKPDEPDVGDLAGAGGIKIWGAFVTLKRRGRLRSCCGHMGGLDLVDAVRGAATRAANDDLRFPCISPSELAFLDLDVSLLYGLAPVTAVGEARAAAIVPGRHGVCLQRGSASALFLPQVAREQNWDADRLLRELCAKAGLPTTAWKQPDTQLHTFEGFAIEGEGPGQDQLPEMPGRYTPQDVAALASHSGRNLAALVTGAVAMYYLPGGPEGRVNGILLGIRRADGGEFAAGSQLDMLKSMPLQATAHRLVESLAASFAQQRVGPTQLAGCQMTLMLLSDPAMHGSAAEPDLRGIDPARRTVLVNCNGRVGWAFDPAKTPQALLTEALASLPSTEPQHTLVFSLDTATDLPAAHGAVLPRAAAGANVRPPAVAGSFYPGEPGQLLQTVDTMLRGVEGVPATCSAVMVPHAGYRFSGALAAKTLASARIPPTVIIIGPKHTNLGVDWAVAPHAAWQLPGLIVPSDPELARLLAQKIPGLELDAAAHQQEHGIEVQLPFIARLAPQSRVVGIVMGSGTLERCRAFATALAEVIDGLPQTPLLVISTDMNHYATDAENRELDALALAELERLNPEALYHTCHKHHISMCGMLPAVVVLETLRQLGRLGSYRRVGYGTSADATGDTSRVVGYAGMTFGEGRW